MSLKETEHFQALVGCKIEKPSTKELTAWLLSKMHVIRQLKCRLMIIQPEGFRESSGEHCKTAMLIQNNLAAFWLATLGVCGESITIWLGTKKI